MKKIALIGAGHANIQVLYQLKDHPDFEITLISAPEQSPYSGMLPGYLMGEYQFSDLHFHLPKISKKLNVTYLNSEIVAINSKNSTVTLKDQSIISFDLASINLGIHPVSIQSEGENQNNVLYVKPIAHFLTQWQTMKSQLTQDQKIVIIGGGAGAFEIAIATKNVFPSNPVTLIAGKNGLLSDFSKRTRGKAYKALKRNQIHLVEGNPVQSISQNKITLKDQSDISFDYSLVGISAQAPKIFENIELPKNSKNFLKVMPTLQVLDHPLIFAAGDCCEFTRSPLPKAGVFAVRQGPLLAKNLIQVATNQSSLTDYVPQKRFLTILVSGQKKAIATYGPLTVEGRWVWYLKKWIDQRFMKRFS